MHDRNKPCEMSSDFYLRIYIPIPIRMLLNFENWRSGKVSKCAKIWLWKKFVISEIIRIFLLLFSSKNTNLGAHFLFFTSYDSINFWILLLVKWCPIYDSSHLIPKFNNFLWVCWFWGNNLSNFVPPTWKLDNSYYHSID